MREVYHTCLVERKKGGEGIHNRWKKVSTIYTINASKKILSNNRESSRKAVKNGHKGRKTKKEKE